MNAPNKYLRAGIRTYCAAHGRSVVEGHYAPVSPLAGSIAREYGRLPKVSAAARVAYLALAREVREQYEYARDALGVRMEPWAQAGQPYATSAAMCADVRDNRHLWYFTGGEYHPYLGEYNTVFRAVHDLFGHAAEGYEFGPRGEENAWIHHSMMFSPLAQRALTTETRGQNCWVNAGPYAALPASERPFAEQKAALLPEWATDWQTALKGANK